MNILILHRMGHPKTWRKAVADLEFALPLNDTENNYLIHNAIYPLPNYVQEYEFDAIILGPTFLCSRYDAQLFKTVLN